MERMGGEKVYPEEVERAFLEVAAIPRPPNGKADYKAAKALAEQRP